MKNYYQLFIDIENSMNKNPNFVDISFQYVPKPKLEQINKIENLIKFQIPEEYLSFYQKTNGITVNWSYRDHSNCSHLICGNFSIPVLERLFGISVYNYKDGKFQNDLIYTTNISSDKEIDLKSLMLLDNLNYGNFVVIKEVNNQPKLYLLLYCNQLYPLKIKLEEYLDYLLQTRGMYLWQQYFIEDDFLKDGPIVPDEFHTNMAHLFPDVDLKQFPIISSKSSNFPNFHHYIKDQNKTDYCQLLTEKVNDLKDLKNITIENFIPNPIYTYEEKNWGTSIGSINKAYIALGQELPKSMIQFFSSLNGFALRWVYNTGGDAIIGIINLLNLENIIGGEMGFFKKDWDDNAFKDVLWFEDYDEDLIEYIKPFKIIDNIEGMSREVVIRFTPEQDEPQLFISDKWEFYPLSINFSEYIEYLFLTMGMVGWQFLFVSPENKEKDFNHHF